MALRQFVDEVWKKHANKWMYKEGVERISIEEESDKGSFYIAISVSPEHYEKLSSELSEVDGIKILVKKSK